MKQIRFLFVLTLMLVSTLAINKTCYAQEEVGINEAENKYPDSPMVIDEDLFVNKIKDALLTQKVFEKYGKGEHTFVFLIDIDNQDKKVTSFVLVSKNNGLSNEVDSLIEKNKMVEILDSIPFKVPNMKQNGKALMGLGFPIKINLDSLGNIIKDWCLDKNYKTSCSKYAKSELIDGEEPFPFVEQMPNYKSSNDNLMAFISKNIKYPEVAKSAGIEGKVMVEFVIDKQGKVRNAKVLKGIGSGCDEEALRVINMMKDWEPGKQAGKPVNVKMVIPIHFKLQ